MKTALNLTDIVIICVAIAFIILLTLILFSINKDSQKCLSNPLDYTMEKTGAFCSCFYNPTR